MESSVANNRPLSLPFRALLTLVLCVSLVAGFAGAFFGPEWQQLSPLHVFLYNLTVGGSLLLVFSSGRDRPGRLEWCFLAGGGAFGAAAAGHYYPLLVAAPVVLGTLVEARRWKTFEWFPLDFFLPVPASRKFRQAALLCLSLGLFICAATMANEAWFHWIRLPKLDLHVFYLGFSFPISLVTFSLIFARLEKRTVLPLWASEYCFWALNLGVISFFFFIIFELWALQLVAALTLFSVVLLVLRLHWRTRAPEPEWQLYSSALVFLSVGSLTGIAQILVSWFWPEHAGLPLLGVHSATTLFGWNFSGMAALIRGGDFSFKGFRAFIPLQWVFVMAVPAGHYLRFAAASTFALGFAVAGLVMLAPFTREGN